MSTFTFSGQFKNLSKIRDYVGQIAQDAGFNENDVCNIQLAVDEACTNIIEHAYGGEGKGDIRCTCEMVGNDLIITILDHGKPFNLSAVPAPNLTAELEDRACGGLGVYIICQLMDHVEYKSSKTGNIWKIIKTKKY